MQKNKNFTNPIAVAILTLLFTLSLNAKEKPVCKEIVMSQFKNYIVTRQEFFKHDECILPMNENIKNKETNQTIKLDGIVTGLEFTSLDDKDVLKVNYHAGAHSNVVAFFFISTNGDLLAIEGGNIGSGIGDPAIYLDSFNNSLIVISRHNKHKKECRYIKEDIYEYKHHKFTKVGENSLFHEGECKDES